MMRFCRRLFRNTPIQRLKITTFVYKRFAQKAFGQDPIEVPFRGARISYPGGDYTTLPTLMDGVYEKVELDELISYLDSLTSPICAVDIGANVGIWTVLLASHRNVRHVFAFEPSKENLAYLRQNLELNKVINKVTIVESAVSDVDGDVLFDDSGSGATQRISATGSIVVPSVSLDTYMKDLPVDLIKIDVEGFEPLVLSGCWNTIETSLPTLFIEYSLPQANMAGLSWEQAGERLVQIYGGFSLLVESGIQTSSDFAVLKYDRRLLNLMFRKK
jgi:FkbM family methyltransferase